jgi:hypothetical protein
MTSLLKLSANNGPKREQKIVTRDAISTDLGSDPATRHTIEAKKHQNPIAIRMVLVLAKMLSTSNARQALVSIRKADHGSLNATIRLTSPRDDDTAGPVVRATRD